MSSDAMQEKRPIKVGIGQLDKPMTREQALRWGERNMPVDLKRAGFVCSVFVTDEEVHGGRWYRVNYSYGGRALGAVA